MPDCSRATTPRIESWGEGRAICRAALQVRQALTVCAVFAMATVALAQKAVSSTDDWQLGPFIRPEPGNPVITPDRKSTFRDPLLASVIHWEALHTFNPAAVVRHGKIYVLYRAEDDSGSMEIGMHTSRIGLAVSQDGIHFKRRRQPVLYPDVDSQSSRESPGGVEDPRIVESDDGTYVLTYTQWNRKTYSVGIATSSDLKHWTKQGPAFGASGKYANLKYKSAGIVTRLVGGRLKAVRIGGQYWMYWGEIHVHLATSPDLIHWMPVEDSSGEPEEVLTSRSGHFDSGFPETGPPPMLVSGGILVIYNGKNAADNGDPRLAPETYSAGQALFSAVNPAQLLGQTRNPFLYPTESYERSGQYKAGTTFAESLVYFKGRWFLYYGCADSLVAVAIYDPASSKIGIYQ